MAYATGLVLTLNEVYDALATFMAANGWTLLDTVATRDQVFTSSGSDGKLSMTYRLTSSAEAWPTSNPFGFAGEMGTKFPHILARGYTKWDAPTNTGTNEFGRWGPWFLTEGVSSNAVWQFFRWDGTPAPVTSTRTTWLLSGSTSNGGTQYFDGHRKMYGPGITQPGYKMLDFASGVIYAAPASGPASQMATGLHAVVHDPATDRDYVFVVSATAVAVDQFWKWDVDANTWTRMATPSWGTTPGGGFLVWDGGDFIYGSPGNATTLFSRYQISTDTWVTRAVLPVARANFGESAGTNPNNTVYLPASMTGFATDVIYTFLDTTTSIKRYNVATNDWAGPNITCPFTPTNSITSLVWDRAKYMYIIRETLGSPYNNFYRADVTVAPGTWTSLGQLSDVGAQSSGGGQIHHHLVSKVRGSNLIPGAYFIHGDADHISVVVRVGAAAPTSNYYWMYFGRYDTAYRSTIRALTAPATPGIRATLAVNSSAGYIAGETVLLWDPDTGTSEKVIIYDVPSGTSYRVNQLVGSFGTGTRVGVDPVQHILTGDSAQACAPLGAKGQYKADYHAANFHTYAALRTDLSLPSGRGPYMPVPIRIDDPYTSFGKEVLGTLKGVFYLGKGAYPAPQAEDVLNVNGGLYKFFPLAHPRFYSGVNYGLVIGPIA